MSDHSVSVSVGHIVSKNILTAQSLCTFSNCNLSPNSKKIYLSIFCHLTSSIYLSIYLSSLIFVFDLILVDHFLREVEEGSPAERAGLQDGEILLEVNGESVESLKHQEVVDRVRMSGQEVSITTITPSGLEFYTKVSITSESVGKMHAVIPDTSKPNDIDVASSQG